MHATLTFVAAACIVIAVLLSFSVFQGANYYEVSPQVQIALAVIVLTIAAIFIWMIYKAAKADLYKIKTGKEALVGSVGVAMTDLNPKGEIRVVGEFWQATAKDEWIKNGEKVKVVGMEGMFLVVTPQGKSLTHSSKLAYA